jgi:hypothetical protein
MVIFGMSVIRDPWSSDDFNCTDVSELIGLDMAESYPIRNPHILAERQNAVSTLRAKFPTLSAESCEATLEEHNWNQRLAESAAADLVSEFCSSGLTRPSEDDPHPSINALRAAYPDIETPLIIFAARQSAYDVETASTVLGADQLLENLRRDVAALSRANSPRDRFLATLSTVPANHAATRKSVLTHNMHGLTRANYRDFVLDVLANVASGIERVNFITGPGRHSKNETPLLRPLVLKLAEVLGYECALMPANPGIVQVFISRPAVAVSGIERETVVR